MAATDAGLSQYFSDQGAPQLQYRKIWATGVSYYINAESMAWAGGTMTVVARNHNLATNDVVATLSNNTADVTLNFTTKTVTVVDADTFTFASSDPASAFPRSYSGSPLFLDEKITITSNGYSRLLFKPVIIQVNTLSGSDTIFVQTKIHPEAPWVTQQTLAIGDGNAIINFTTMYNFVRLARGAGSTQIVAFAS